MSKKDTSAGPGCELPNSLLNILEHDRTFGSLLMSISIIASCVPAFSTSNIAHSSVPCHEHGHAQQLMMMILLLFLQKQNFVVHITVSCAHVVLKLNAEDDRRRRMHRTRRPDAEQEEAYFSDEVAHDTTARHVRPRLLLPLVPTSVVHAAVVSACAVTAHPRRRRHEARHL